MKKQIKASYLDKPTQSQIDDCYEHAQLLLNDLNYLPGQAYDDMKCSTLYRALTDFVQDSYSFYSGRSFR